mmetsp:Transcript_66010/g.171306  ORF Transcript_66010/g.171306 Transcript_66010/m.171306 type:complete len:219 (+) Transcript_66010:1081-1737(+)
MEARTDRQLALVEEHRALHFCAVAPEDDDIAVFKGGCQQHVQFVKALLTEAQARDGGVRILKLLHGQDRRGDLSLLLLLLPVVVVLLLFLHERWYKAHRPQRPHRCPGLLLAPPRLLEDGALQGQPRTEASHSPPQLRANCPVLLYELEEGLALQGSKLDIGEREALGRLEKCHVRQHEVHAPHCALGTRPETVRGQPPVHNVQHLRHPKDLALSVYH